MELATDIEHTFSIKLDIEMLLVLHTVSNLVKAVKEALLNQTLNFTDQLIAGNPLDEGPAELVPPPRKGVACKLLTLFRVLSPLIWRLEMKGTEYIPATRPFILCPNQESDLDTFWVSSCLPPSVQYNLCCVVKQETFEKPKSQFFADLVGGIPINREGNSLPALRACAKALRNGRPLLIYPEGTRTRSGELLPFYRGPAKLSITTGVPIIPVRIKGSYEIFPFYRQVPRFFNWQRMQRLPIQIIFGLPILPPEVNQGVSAEVFLTQKLHETIKAL
jgi:1-acyl-sn-glycerol-3-phosphate acyltransferase